MLRLFRPYRKGYRGHFPFPNGYTLSVVCHDYFYDNEDYLWEIAILSEKSGCLQIDYTTPITNDVIGNLTPEQVFDYARQVSELPNANA